MAQWVKDPALALQQLQLIPGLGTSPSPCSMGGQKKKKSGSIWNTPGIMHLASCILQSLPRLVARVRVWSQVRDDMIAEPRGPSRSLLV